MEDHNSLQTYGYYKNLSKHRKCSKCIVALTQDNHKKGRTVCQLCYNNHVLTHHNNEFCSNSFPKSDVSTHTVYSNKQDSSNKQTSCRKRNISNKNIVLVTKIILLFQKNIDPDCLVGKFEELYYSEYDYIEQSQAAREHAKEILYELLRVEAIT